MRSTRRLRSLLLLALLLPAGCGIDYFLGVAAGAIGSIARTRTIDEALADPAVDEAIKDKLRFVLEVRQFGIDEIGQNAGDAFTRFDDDLAAGITGPVGYSVSGCAKESFTPFTWYFPLVGAVQYKGFFSEFEARREALLLELLGFDTFIGSIAGFSTLGILPDPIRSSQLAAFDELYLAELILHELTHGTLYKVGDTTFNETMSQFVGRNAARQFWIMRRGPTAPITLDALARYDDEDRIDAYIGEVYETLSAFYAQPISREEKLAGRGAQFDAVAATFDTLVRPMLNDPDRYRSIADLGLNNAFLLSAAQYRGDLPIYRDVLERLGGRFPDFFRVMRDAADRADSFAYLEDWLDMPP
ncbi:MAG: aminopeptidase [Phycisphaerae bacterium]|nr:aminopeptidase [Phycisphaerae bacterium]